jgi:tetratricopeptide (TPR) repeat protein
MRKIDKIRIFALALITSFMFSGCDGFLEQIDTSSINENSLFKKKEDGYAMVTGVYNTFHYSVDYMLKGIWFTANFPSQDFHNAGSDTFWNTYEIPTDFDALNAFWSGNYIGISRANAAIPILEDMIAGGVLTEAEGNQLIAECYFLRGVFYYYLGADFGGVPLELEVVKDDGLHPRNTQDEVFEAVRDDMKRAAEYLPWKADQPLTDRGRATKEAALAYQGDAMMWLKDYEGALAIFNQLDGKCQLEETYLNIHEIANRNGKESIFEVQFTSETGGAMGWGAFGVNNHWISSFCMPKPVSNFAYAYGDKKLYDSFQFGDSRKLATIIGPGDEHPSPLINFKDYPRLKDWAQWGGNNQSKEYYQDESGDPLNTCGTVSKPWLAEGNVSGSEYYCVKYWRNPEVCGTKGQNWFMSPDNVMMMRYAQVLLSKAECLYRTSNSAGAIAIVNQIRDRAFDKLTNPSVIVPAPVETDVMQIILDEYRYELGGECSLWFLLRRSGLHHEFIKKQHGITIPTGKDLMPIPQTQIGLNQELVQNPGY